MPKLQLTQSQIGKLTCPPGQKRIEYCDTTIPGLFLEVRHTGNSSYYLRYRSKQGKTRYQKLGIQIDLTLAEARKQARKLRAEILLGRYPGSDAKRGECITFSEFFQDKYLPFAKPRKRSWRDDEKLYNRRLKALFGDTPLDKITRHALQQMHSDLRSTLSPSSCDHHLGLMSRCLRLASDDWKIIPENVSKGLKKYNEDNRRDRLLTDSELQRLVSVLDTYPARTPCLVIKWLLYTACRKGEALHLRWADINRDTRTWTIQAANAKSKKRRVVPLNSAALAILDELKPGNTTEWVFLNSRTGERLQSIDRVWNQRIRKAAGLPDDVVLHSMRHMGASMALASGADLATVRDLLGHADISTTEKYLHASGQSLRGGSAGIENYLEKALANKAS